MVHGNNKRPNNKKNKSKSPGEKSVSFDLPEPTSTPNHVIRNLPEGVPYQKVTEDYSRPKVFVATPCYVGQVHVKYMESIMALQHTLLQNGIGFEFFNIPFDSLIPRARNASVTRFMKSPGATHLLFVDADIQFHPASVIKMLHEKKDVICGCYPKKSVDFESVKNNYSKTMNQIELIQSSVHYAFNFKPQRSHRMERGVVEILDAPTGFMMVKKQVIRDMVKRYPETEYINDVKAYQINPDDRFFDLFQSQVFDRRYLSEDYGFCRLWQMMGGQIYADLTVRLNHIGQFCYFGDPIVYLKHSNSMTMTTEPMAETKTETKTEPEREPITETKTETETETKTETKTEPEPEPITETETKTEPEPEPITETEHEYEREPITETEHEYEPEP